MEFYDPDTEPQPPAWASRSVQVDEPRSAMPRPIPELAVLALGVTVVVLLLWSSRTGLSSAFDLRFVLMQIAYPLGMALIVAAVTSLLVRRVLRGHRQIQAEEAAALRDDLADLAARIDAARP